jgi:2-beta-glucuronyltransferase
MTTEQNRLRTLVLTGHDYRSRLRATLHFLIDELASLGDVRVFTPGMSELLRLKRALPDEASHLTYNRVVEHGGAQCYVWRTLLHPFNPRKPWLHPVSAPLFDLYRQAAPPVLREWAGWADTIIVESGFPALFLEDLAAFNPGARLIYFASDALETIGCDPHLIQCLNRAAPKIAWACILSPKMSPFVPPGIRKVVVPQGVDTSIAALAGKSPYSLGRNAVSIGAMLFDPRFFRIAAEAFPEVTFHIIGSQAKPDPTASNVVWYETKPFAELPSYIKHADFGIAAYRDSPGTEYLSDTSLKLIQYGMLGVPAVCPHFAAGGKRLRFGYTPGDDASIITAITSALASADRTPVPGTSWRDVVRQVLRLGTAGAESGEPAYSSTSSLTTP